MPPMVFYTTALIAVHENRKAKATCIFKEEKGAASNILCFTSLIPHRLNFDILDRTLKSGSVRLVVKHTATNKG